MCAVDMAVTIALEYMNTLRAEIESRNKAVLMLASGKLAFFVSLVTAIAAVTTTSGIEVSVIIIFSPLMLLLFDVMIHEQIHGIFLIGSYIHTEIEQKVLAKHLDGQPDKRLVLWQTYQSVFRDARGSDDEEAKRDDKPWTVSLLRGRLHGEMAHVYVTWIPSRSKETSEIT